jgi:hypothetical protein
MHGVLGRGKEGTGDLDTDRSGKQSATIAWRFTNIYRYIYISYISRHAMKEESRTESVMLRGFRGKQALKANFCRPSGVWQV